MTPRLLLAAAAIAASFAPAATASHICVDVVVYGPVIRVCTPDPAEERVAASPICVEVSSSVGAFPTIEHCVG